MGPFRLWTDLAVGGGTVDIASPETVGLTMAGLRHVDMDTANRLALMLAELADRERRLARKPHEPTQHR